MCGRYAFDDIKDIYEARKILEEIASRLGEDAAAGVKTGEVFPSESAAVIAQTSPQGYSADVMPWGYPMSGSKRLIINARSESLFSSGMFSKSVTQKKCLIPCTGFYEWKSEGKTKQKYIICPEESGLFYLAGLYNSFAFAGEYNNRFVIITAPANEAMKEIHERMPLIVPACCAEQWLGGCAKPDTIKRLYEMTKRLSIKTA